MRKLLSAGVLTAAVLVGAPYGHAADWIKNGMDIPNKNVEANYHDADSVKVKAKTLTWTEKFVLTDFGAKNYSKHLAKFPACKKGMADKGQVTQHQLDFEIKKGKFRLVAKRNYNKKNELVCTDKDMGKDLDTSWKEIEPKTPIYERYYLISTKYKIGDL